MRCTRAAAALSPAPKTAPSMPVLLRVEGPSLNRELLLDDGAAALTVGRDPAATLHLPDPERALSRRHLSIAAAGGGVRVTVLSSVNGATTSQGELAPGQTAQLAVGERVALGPYTIRIEPASGRAAPAVVGGVAPGVDDPFAALARNRAVRPESIITVVTRATTASLIVGS